MLSSIVGALSPVVFTLLLGIFAGWRGDLGTAGANALNRMVLTYALPLLMFAGITGSSRAKLAEEWPLAVALLAGLLGPAVIAFCVTRFGFRRDLGGATLQALAFGFPAIPFIGLPILRPLIGDRTMHVVAWAGIIDSIIILPTAMILLSLASGKPGSNGVARTAFREAMVQPVVLASFAGLALVLLGISLPADVDTAFKLLGATVGGVSLFASGIILQAQTLSFSRSALVTAVGRNFVCPGAAFLALTALHADHVLRGMVVLALSLAVGPIQIILAVRYDSHQQENAALVLYSNLLCFLAVAFFAVLIK